MGHNVEIKARVTRMDAVRLRAATLAGGEVEILQQHDTFYACAHGRLKLRRFQDGSGELIHYHRDDTPGPKSSNYTIYRCTDPDTLHAMLAASLGIAGEVLKRRELYLVGRTRIHLDAVAELGDFLELEVVLDPGEDGEVAHHEAADLMSKLGVAPGDLVSGAYLDLLARRK